MPALDTVLLERLERLKAQSLARTLWDDCHEKGVTLWRNEKNLISFAGNDYLGMAQNPRVIAAGAEALQRYGAGSGASRLVSGNHPLYAQLEARLASMKQAEAALVFGSGYLAHLGVIPALVGKGDLILLDAYCHASMFDAARLSGAALMRFEHNDPPDCEAKLKKFRERYRRCLIATETIFSMDGDLAPQEALADLAKRHDAWMLIDDAHGLFSPAEPVRGDILVSTLSKAVGAYGGYVCGSRLLIEYLTSSARSLIFSTALPPSVLASANTALELIEAEPERTALPMAHARLFCKIIGLPAAQSQIVPIIIGDNERTLEVAAHLEEAGFLVPAIRPPTVPKGTARLRVSFSALHTQAEVEALACAVTDVLKSL